MKINCPYCQAELSPRASQAGAVVRCPACQRSLQLPPAPTPDATFATGEPFISSRLQDRTHWWDSPLVVLFLIILGVFLGSLLAGIVTSQYAEAKMKKALEQVPPLPRQ